MLLYYRKQHGSGLPLRHTLTVGLHIASALWHLHPSIVHRCVYVCVAAGPFLPW